MDDLISRQAAIDLWVWGDTDMAAHSRVVHVEDIEALTSAQPELIRCKDCKWNKANEWVDCMMFGMYGRTTDGFCSRAERRTDALNRC